MIIDVTWLYLKVMALLFTVLIFWGWLFPAMISSPDWILTILGAFGLLASIPLVGMTIHSTIKDGVKLYNKFMEKK